MVENTVLVICYFLMFQSIVGCKSPAATDNDGEKVHLVKEVLTSAYHGTVTPFLVWNCSAVEW